MWLQETEFLFDWDPGLDFQPYYIVITDIFPSLLYHLRTSFTTTTSWEFNLKPSECKFCHWIKQTLTAEINKIVITGIKFVSIWMLGIKYEFVLFTILLTHKEVAKSICVRGSLYTHISKIHQSGVTEWHSDFS